LKKFVYILIFIIGLNFTSFAQNKTAGPDPAGKLIKFYPNPATTYINFDFQRGYDKSFTLEIYNFMGKKVYELQNVLPRTNLSLTEFYRGLYSYKLFDKNEKVVESGRFLVIK
jgi:hypothetical protein